MPFTSVRDKLFSFKRLPYTVGLPRLTRALGFEGVVKRFPLGFFTRLRCRCPQGQRTPAIHPFLKQPDDLGRQVLAHHHGHRILNRGSWVQRQFVWAKRSRRALASVFPC